LLAGRDDRVQAIDAEVKRMELDVQRKELAAEQLHREIAAAEAGEHASELKRLRRAAEASKKKTPDTLAKIEQGMALIEQGLDELDEIEAPVTAYNAIAPEGAKLDSAEFTFRGGQKPEPRQERSRKEVGTFYVLADGQEVPSKLLETLKLDDDGRATVEVIDPSPRSMSGTDMREISESRRDFHGDYYHRRRIRVRLMRRVDTTFDEYRAAYVPTPLRAEVGQLPSVLPVADPRKPRETITVRTVEPVETVPAKAVEAEGAAA
jgi:hypothetical protein